MIYIIIPVFNRLNYTLACLKSLSHQSIDDYKIIVVDHGSSDGTSDAIKSEFPDVVLIYGSSDLWWTGATNLGVREVLNIAADDDLVLVINNDLVVEHDYLETLLSLHKQIPRSVIGSISVNINNPEKIVFAGVKWNNKTAKFRPARSLNEPYSSFKLKEEYYQSDLLPGRGTLIPVAAFKEVGIFDEARFPHYAADEDLSLMCKLKGYQVLIATNAIVKSHVEDTGLNFVHKKLGLSQFIKTLSSIKSSNNLSIRLRWAKKNAPYPYLYYSFDLMRLFGSYIRSSLR